MEAESGVGDDIDPRSGRRLSWTQKRDVFPSVGCESSKAIEEFESLCDGSRGRRPEMWAAAPRGPRGRCGRYLQTIELVGQVAAARGQNDTRDGCEPRAGLVREQIRTQQENRAPRVFRAGLWLRRT